MRFIDSLDIHTSTKHIIAPPLTGGSVIWCFKYRNAIQIRDRITFDFYTGLPHTLSFIPHPYLVCKDQLYRHPVERVPKFHGMLFCLEVAHKKKNPGKSPAHFDIVLSHTIDAKSQKRALHLNTLPGVPQKLARPTSA